MRLRDDREAVTTTTSSPPRSRTRFRQAVPLLLAVAAQSAGNLVFHGLSGRWLSPADYGALGALLAATTALSVPLGALQAAAAGLVARGGPHRATAVGLVRVVGVSAVTGAALLIPATPLLSHWWHLQDWWLATLVLPYAVASAVLSAVRGLLLGAGAAPEVATTYLASTALRLLLGVALTPVLGVAGAMGATVLGEAAGLVVGLGAARRRLPEPGPAARLGRTGLVLPSLAVTGLFLLSTVDLLLARHFLSPDASGSYVAAATISKTVLALPAALVSVVYPDLVRAWPDPAARGPALRRSLALVSGGAWAGALGVVALPRLVLGLLYGDAFDDAVDLVRLLALVAAVTSTATLLTYAALARSSRWLWLPWVGAGLEVVLVARWHDSPLEVAGASAASVLPTVLALVLSELPAWRGDRKRAGSTPASDPEAGLSRA